VDGVQHHEAALGVPTLARLQTKAELRQGHTRDLGPGADAAGDAFSD